MEPTSDAQNMSTDQQESQDENDATNPMASTSAPQLGESCTYDNDDHSSDSESDTETQHEAESKMNTHIAGDLVQIHASPAEVWRRIQAFTEGKKAEVSDNNIREFCFDLPSSEENSSAEQSSCARVDSVFVSRSDTNSRVYVTRVRNAHGPQVRAYRPNRDHCGRSSSMTFRSSVDERIANAERQLNIDPDVKADLFSRLKAVEEGLLFLNGLSPEYFETGKMPQRKRKQPSRSPSPPRTLPAPKPRTISDDDDIADIGEKLVELRRKLKEMRQPPV